MWNASASVVVCVDGSDAAIGAVRWAIPEAVVRDVPLRIVHVIPEEVGTDNEPRCNDQLRLDTQYAESSLREAGATAASAADDAVKVETEILWGSVESALIEESGRASLICLGSVGIGPVARSLLGSTAATVAENAHCPVAIIREPRDPSRAETEWITVGVEHRADNEPVIEAALEEARLRHCPVLAVGLPQGAFGGVTSDETDRRVARWSRTYPDVHIRVAASLGGIADFLAEYDDASIGLAVVGSVGANTVAEIIGPHGDALIRHSQCSLLVVH
jgi:nucleotide-binding universal stress UspA family protein